MQKAGCVLKNEKSEKKDPEAFIRNNQDKMRFGSFSYIYITYIHYIILYVCRGLLRKKTFGMKAFFRCAGMP